MTARFLLNLREWDHRMTNPETEQWDTHGRGGDHHSPIRFQKSEPHATQWTIHDVLVDDPLLKPVASETDMTSSDTSSSAQDSETPV
jgi:hypothetical protein